MDNFDKKEAAKQLFALKETWDSLAIKLAELYRITDEWSTWIIMHDGHRAALYVELVAKEVDLTESKFLGCAKHIYRYINEAEKILAP